VNDQLHYAINFYYGIQISEKDLLAIIKQRYSPFDERVDFFLKGEVDMTDAESWYQDVLINLIVWHRSPPKLGFPPVSLRIICRLDEERPNIVLAIEETCHFTKGLQETFDLTLNFKSWNRLLRKVCDQFGIPWDMRTFDNSEIYSPSIPAFHLESDFYNGYNPFARYHGVFFYGLKVDDYVSFFEHLIRMHNDLMQSCFKVIQDICSAEGFIAGSDIYSVEGFNKVSFDETIYSDEISWDELVEFILESEEFQKFFQDSYSVEGFIAGLDGIWCEDATDPICIFAFSNSEGPLIYLGIRSTQHYITKEERGFVRLATIDRAAWDTLLQAKCTKYGIPFQTPHFTILRDDRR
jgi:hypothetical protein